MNRSLNQSPALKEEKKFIGKEFVIFIVDDDEIYVNLLKHEMKKVRKCQIMTYYQ